MISLSDKRRGGWCIHGTQMVLFPFMILWGPGASSDMLRRSARGTKCGRKGATLQHPSWAARHVGFETVSGKVAVINPRFHIQEML